MTKDVPRTADSYSARPELPISKAAGEFIAVFTRASYLIQLYRQASSNRHLHSTFT